MKSFSLLYWGLCSGFLLLSFAACQPEDAGSTTASSGAVANSESVGEAYLAGTIRLHGKLIEPPDGALHLVAKGEGMATPLVFKLALSDGIEVKGEKALDLEFCLDKTSGMLGEMPRSALPEKLDFEISWTPDGFVPGIIEAHTKRMTVSTGLTDLDVQMFPGAVDPAAAEGEGLRPWPRKAVAPPPDSLSPAGD